MVILLAVAAGGFDTVADPAVQGTDARPLLPAHRIVTFYGNPLSPCMGVLGWLEPDAMMDRLAEQAAAWARADTAHPVLPARPGTRGAIGTLDAADVNTPASCCSTSWTAR